MKTSSRQISSVWSEQTQQDQSFVFEVIAPRSEDGAQEVVGLETVMQSLVLSPHHPIALEIAGEPNRKRLLVRATNHVALIHAEQQLRLRYPQADIRYVTQADDPLRCALDETVTVAELRPGAAEYLPMREWRPEILQQQKGIDPLLGVLAALATVPANHRAIAQIALVPAPQSWSKPHQRKAIEHALEPERVQRQAHTRSGKGVPSTAGLVLLGLLLAALFVWQHVKQALPAWLRQTFVEVLLHGHFPPLTGEQQAQLAAYVGIALVIMVGIALLVARLKRYFARPVYDQRVVASRTGRMAYRGRIRLYLIGRAEEEQEQGQQAALTSLIAAYRQFHTADAGHFVPKFLSARRSEQLLATTRPQTRFHTLLPFTALWLKKAGKGMTGLIVLLCKKVMNQWRSFKAKRTPVAYHRMSAPIQWFAARWEALTRRWMKMRTVIVRSPFWHMTVLLLSRLRILLSFTNAILICLLRILIRQVLRVWSHVVRQNTRLPGWAHGLERSNHFFTGDFLSSAWRLPGRADLVELTGLAQKRERTLPLPLPLRTTHQSQGRSIGECLHSGISHPFLIPSGFFGNHTFLGGKSGEGKSTLMVHLAKAVIHEGERGIFLLDPHGDLAEDVLRVVPEEREANVVLIDLGDADFCVGFNPLDVTLGRERDLVVSGLISVFSHIWQTSWGPRMEAPFRAAILTLFEANERLVQQDSLHGPDQQYTLLDIMQVLVDESFCHHLLGGTSDLFIHRFWYEYYSPLSLVQQRDRIDPVLTKMLQFESHVARRILGQSRSTIRLHELVQQRKLLIVRLAFSEAGIQTGGLIGATLLGFLMVTLREQSRLAVEERARMVLFLDEFQTFGAGADLSQLLAELRKYGGSAVLATQSLEYLTAIDPTLLPTVQANTKQYFLFRLSAPDATSIAQELDIAPADLVNLDTHTCYVRLVYGGQQQPTFSLHMSLPILRPEEQMTILRERCQHTYCRPAADIEHKLVEALGKAIAASIGKKQEAEQKKQKKESQEQDTTPTDEQPKKHDDSTKGTSKRFDKATKQKSAGPVTSFVVYPYEQGEETEQKEEDL